MSQFFVLVLQSFLLPAMLLSQYRSAQARASLPRIALATMVALAAGTALGAAWPTGQTFVLGATLAQIVVLALLIVAQAGTIRGLQSLRRPPFALAIHAMVITAAAFRWGQNAQLKAVTPTGIVNTDLLLNTAAIACAFVVVATLACLLGWMDRRQPRWRWPFIAAFAGLLLVPLAGELMLALIKLQVLPTTRGWITAVARTTDFSSQLSYATLALLLVRAGLYGVGVVRPQRAVMQNEPNAIARRQATATYRETRRVLLGTLALAPLAGGVQWYWKVIASRPLRLSEAVRVALDADGVLRLPVPSLRDGRLHRFAWVAEDGKLVRFFIINRYLDKLSLSTVFDACLLCGDQGYAQQGDQIVCSACGVHLFTPSIGKPGGCNPVPIEGWQVDGDVLSIPRAGLEAGRPLFTTVVELTVTDPVDGSQLKNTTAKYSYTHGSSTYFFNDPAHFEAFRETPEKYVKEL